VQRVFSVVGGEGGDSACFRKGILGVLRRGSDGGEVEVLGDGGREEEGTLSRCSPRMWRGIWFFCGREDRFMLGLRDWRGGRGFFALGKQRRACFVGVVFPVMVFV